MDTNKLLNKFFYLLISITSYDNILKSSKMIDPGHEEIWIYLSNLNNYLGYKH